MRAWFPVVVVAWLLLTAAPSLAGMQSELDSFLNDWETQLSTTKPGFYEGQQRGFIVGGAADMHFPNRNVTPLTLSLPQIKAGCGGISFFGGAFSYINGQEFVQFLQNIAQNAVGVAFDMALRTLCPQCATVLANMENIFRNMTSNLGNSCRDAQKLLKFAAGPMNLQEIARNNCTAINTTLGVTDDTWGGAFKCKDDAALRDADLKAAADDAAHPNDPPKRLSQNIFWAAYNNLQGLNPFWDTDVGEYLMSLLGTQIVRFDGGGSTPTANNAPAHTIEVDQLLEGWNAGEHKILRCGDSSTCLDVTAHDASSFDGFEKKIEDKLTEYATRLENRQRANPEPILQANVSGMPVVRLLAMVNAVPGGKDYVISTTKRTIAVNLVDALVKEMIKAVKAEVAKLNDTGLTQPYMDRLNERTHEINRRLGKYVNDMSVANSNLRVIIEMARQAEGQRSPALMGNLGFAARKI